MERKSYGEEETIILIVALPSCMTCRERVQNLLKEMNCWEKVEIGYPMDYGTKIWLYCNQNDKETDFWECAKRAKELLETYHYRVI